MLSPETLEGLDLHYHANPDAFLRACHAIEAGQQYQAFRYGVVLRSHLGSTVEVAALCQSMGLPVFGSVNLNHIAGGIDERSILRALATRSDAQAYRVIVDLPTFRPSDHRSRLARAFTQPRYAEQVQSPESLLNGRKLKKSVLELLQFAKSHPILLSTGHATAQEVLLLVEEAARIGLPKLLINQPANPMTNLCFEALQVLTAYEGVYVEQTALTRLLAYQSEADFGAVLKHLPRTVYSSDLGQKDQLSISEWFEQSETWFNSFQLIATRRRELCHTNPFNLLTI